MYNSPRFLLNVYYVTPCNLVPHLEEDDIQQGAGGHPLHDGDGQVVGVLLAGGGVEHGEPRPRPRHRGQGEGEDVEEDEAPVHLVGHLGVDIYRSRYLDIYLSSHQLLPDAQRDDELV